MIFDIIALINIRVITTANLEGFSDELKESMAFFVYVTGDSGLPPEQAISKSCHNHDTHKSHTIKY